MTQFIQKTFSSLHNRNFRLYFLGQAISLSGTWMQSVSQDWLVLQITGSGTALGTVTAIQFLPVLLFGAWGGVIADRFPKRIILLVTQSIAGILAILLGILVFTHAVQLWMIYLFALALGFVNTVDSPTRQSFVMEMVGKEDLPNAVTLNSTELNLARVIGPTIAGVCISLWGLAPSFFINGFSYLAVIVMLSSMRPSEFHAIPQSGKIRGQLVQGFRYVASQPLLRNTLIMMAVIGMFAYEFPVSLPLVAGFTFHADARAYAALTSAMGLGSVVGGLFVAGRKRGSLHRLILMTFVFGAMLCMAALAPTLPTMLAVMVAVGVSSLMFLSLGNVILQLESDPSMRGRVMSLWTVAFLGTTPIGGPIIGWIGEHAGPRWGLATGGIAALMAGSFGYFSCRHEINARITRRIRMVSLPVSFRRF